MVQNDKIALVTGASSGIGRAIAEELGKNGYYVFVNYLKNKSRACETVTSIQKEHGRASIVQADVSSRIETEKMFDLIEKKMGFVSHLVNNAGLTSDGTLMLMSEDQWISVIKTNLDGTFHCSQAALRGMMHRGNGSIVNIVSPSGIRGQAGQCNYSAAKGGIIAFTKSLAREMGRYQIRINAVSPGVIHTAMSDKYIKKHGDSIRNDIPLGRIGNPEDVAPLVVFLCSDMASYITGQIICVDGGLI
ncbi:MAG: hypothetical protein A2161_14005 [Candidatus Schekmanbacteria bacterium RBG_13_48_7]|uniref:Beta-ketoacyl-ACP reductase n=1 Tax=Candidatus Schekmanbacteria bacterium RBG_13_48_7 TaxID=1817878 RepID=A0A1F7S0V5_9BACT|nr:MAG: hypothetical protein A2161_14005 [Candidatus Schekmanbacteria bacterium RBG_13_48_7]